MDNLNIEKFNPTKAEVIKITDKYKNIQIKGLEDKQGYLIAKSGKQELSALRTAVKSYGKEQRVEALKYQKAVIKAENELLKIIKPIEDKIKLKIDLIDGEKEKIRMQKYLPDRKARLKEIDIELEDSELLEMDNTEFENFFNEKKTEILAEKERKLQEAEDKLVEEKKKIEIDKGIAKAKEEARKEAMKQAKINIENAKIQAEKDKKKAVEEAKQKILDEQQEKENAKIVEEEKKKQEAEELRKQEKYQLFLERNDYKDDGSFKIETEDGLVVLYKKIDEIII